MSGEPVEDMKPDYDLNSLDVIEMGPARKQFGNVVRLDDDVAKVFTTADAVNEALRFLIKIARENKREI